MISIDNKKRGELDKFCGPTRFVKSNLQEFALDR